MRQIAAPCHTTLFVPDSALPHPNLFTSERWSKPDIAQDKAQPSEPEPAKDTRPFPKVNRNVTWNRYFAQVTRFLKKRYETCIRSYGLFVKGDPVEILDYIKACYRIYDSALDEEVEGYRNDPDRAEWRQEVDFEGKWLADFDERNRRSFHYFVNRDPGNPGLIYYGQRRTLTELQEGDVVGYSVPSSCWSIGHAR